MSTVTDLDVVSFELLDFEPPCSGPTCERPARWVLHVLHEGEEMPCGTFLACDAHREHNQRRIAQATTSASKRRHVVCKPHKIRSTVTWEAL